MIEFDELGNALEQKWRSTSYDACVFPELAHEALAAAALPDRIAPADILRWILSTAVLPHQHDVGGDFGDLSITLFKGSRFVIDAYYWLDGTTSIHQHAFAGAFQVLAGGSVHSRYDFHPDRVINEHFAIGTLELVAVDLLTRGEIQPILPGKQYIHSLFHLDRPSITITIRCDTPSAATQFNYHRPHIAVDAFYRNAELIKKVQSVSMLLTITHPDADAMIGDVVCSVDLQTAYFVLAKVFRQLAPNRLDAMFNRSTGRDRFYAILARARSAHGESIDVILRVLEEAERQRDIVRRRRAITGDAHRFLLALLLNVQDKESILTLVRRRVPDRDPVDVVVAWVDELAHMTTFGSREPNVLGIEAFGADHVRALEWSLRGRTENADPARLRQLGASILGILTR